jgi:hypothetical protein
MKRLRNEQGIAMVTGLMVALVVLFLSLVVVNLSVHNTASSGRDRDRTQAIDAAEAGLDAWFSGLTTSTGATMCSQTAWDGVLPTSPGASYDVTVTLYSTWPPVPGGEITCVDPLPAAPLGALITSKGSTVSAQTSALVYRTMESEVRLVPVYGGFNKAIFSNTGLNMINKLTENGYQGNDGDVYTNGNFTLNNNTVISGTAYAQGYIDIAQGLIKKDVWANNYVNLTTGIQVFGDATSSTSSVTLDSNTTVYGNAKAGTTVSGGTVKGTTTQNSPSGPPPQVALPQLTYNAQAWIDAGYTVVTYSNCSQAKNFIERGITSGNYVVRITPTCSLSWGNNSSVDIHGNLAIISDGAISTVNQTTWNSVGGAWTLYLVDPYRTGLNCSTGSYDITVSNNTNFNTPLKLFVYSQCTVNFGNNNANGVTGQIIGGTVNITNQMTMNYFPILVPGFNLTGYNGNVSYLREIPNS